MAAATRPPGPGPWPCPGPWSSSIPTPATIPPDPPRPGCCPTPSTCTCTSWPTIQSRTGSGRPLGRRDTRFSDDFVGLYLDTSAEAQRAYLFAVTAAGVQAEGVRVGSSDDVSWDAPWRSGARGTDAGYEVEIAIPWRSVRHPATADRLGLFVLRHIARVGEKSAWPPIDPAIQGLLVQQAVVTGPGPLPPSPPVELLPELTFAYSDEGPSDVRPGYGGVMPGGTVRFSPSPRLGVLATVNPDFSQVESDSAQVDVNRRFALYLQEKRPFFLDGREWFAHPFDQQGGELVYTRAMVSPLAGARATLEGDAITVAGMHVLDAAPGPSVSEGGGWSEADLAGHTASEAILRARHAVGSDGHVGMIVSDRTILGSDLANRLGGFDARLRLSDQAQISGSVLGSWTRFADGSEGAGPAGGLQLEASGRNAYSGGWMRYIHPDFRAENGFVTTADRMGGGGWAGTRIYTDSPLLPQASVTPLTGWAVVDTQGRLVTAGTSPNAWARLIGGIDLNAGANINRELFADVPLDYVRAWWWASGAPSRVPRARHRGIGGERAAVRPRRPPDRGSHQPRGGGDPAARSPLLRGGHGGVRAVRPGRRATVRRRGRPGPRGAVPVPSGVDPIHREPVDLRRSPLGRGVGGVGAAARIGAVPRGPAGRRRPRSGRAGLVGVRQGELAGVPGGVGRGDLIAVSRSR